MYLRAAKTEAQEAGEDTEGMASSVSKLRSEILTLTKNRVDIMLDENSFKSTYQILGEVSKIWDSLADVDQSRLLELMGGKRNANVLSSILTNFDVAEQALETSVNSAGSAMAENDKYLDSIQGRLDQLSATFEKLSTQLLSSTAVKGFVTTLRGLLTVLTTLLSILGGFPGAMLMAAAAITAVVVALKKLTDSASVFNTSSWFKGGKLAMIITAISAIISLISTVVGAISSAQDKIKELNQTVEESRAKQAEITAELEKNAEIRKRIWQLQAEGRSTAADDAELKRIERETSALQAQLDLQKQIEKQSVQEIVENNKTRLSDSYGDDLWGYLTSYNPDADPNDSSTWKTWDDIFGSSTNNTSDQQLLDGVRTLITRYGWKLDDRSGSRTDLWGVFGDVGDALAGEKGGDTWRELLQLRYDDLVERTKNIMGLWSDNPLTDYDKEINRQITYFEDFRIQYMALQGYEKTAYDLLSTSNSYSGFFTAEGADTIESLTAGTEEYEKALQMLQVAQKAGLISDTYTLDSIESLQAAYDDLSREVDENANRWQKLGYEVKSFQEIADGFSSATDTINQAQEDMEKNGRLSIKTILALEKAGLADYIERTADGYVLADNALNRYITAQRIAYSSAVTGAVKHAKELIQSQSNVAVAYNATTESVLAQLKALRAAQISKLLSDVNSLNDSLSISARDVLAFQRTQQGATSFQYNDSLTHRQLNYLLSLQERGWASYAQYREALSFGSASSVSTVWDGAITDIENALASKQRFEDLWAQYQKEQGSSASSAGSGTSKTAGERASDAWKTRLNEQKHLLQMGKITEDEYYRWLSDNYRKDLGNYAETLDERRSLDEDYYNWLQNQYKKDLDEQKKALQDRQNELRDFYDRQKKMIEDAYNQEEEENKRVEYAKEIARLDTLISRLSLDTSQEAKRRLAEAQDELEKQRKEYEDWEKGNAKDAVLEALDAQYEAENKEIENQVQKIDSTVESLDSTTSAIYDVISQWAQERGYAIPQYARGTASAFGGGAITQERASELIGMHVGSGRFTMLSPHSKVWSGVATDVLYRFANAPGSFIAALMSRIGRTPGGQNMVAMGDIVINGNADSGTVAALKRERSALVYQVLSELKKLK